METLGIRQLQNNPSEVIRNVENNLEPALITRHGRPAAVILPIDEGSLEDYILANAPEYVADMKAADRDLREGKTEPMKDVFDSLDVDA